MPIPPRFSPFLEIKSGNEKPPIIIAHGLSGTVQVSELARHIQTGHPVYAIQARGIDGREEPFHRVEDMADLYLNTLDAIQPSDPYILIGYSFGGLVALEMAQRLVRAGKRVALLVLLDAVPHARFMPFRWRLRLWAKRLRTHIYRIGRLPPRKSYFYLTNRLKRRLRIARSLKETRKTPALSSRQAALRRVNERAYLAYASYRPRYYPGKINFVTTEDRTFFPGDPAAIWTNLSAELEVDVVPGNHMNIVTTECEGLAAVLTRHVQEAVPGKEE
jgi:acetoacetyl-CoA synthetase